VDVVVDSSGIETVLYVLDRGVGFQHLSRLTQDRIRKEAAVSSLRR